jgi:hypothetical protein
MENSMLTDFYILLGTKVKIVDQKAWGDWWASADRRVERGFIGESEVSTVFLGVVHGHDSDGQPLLFETLVFGGPLADEMTRCATYEEAVVMHKEMCARVLSGIR